MAEADYGGYQDICSVNNATLNRFFALHYLLPFILVALVLMHLIALHDQSGSNLGPKFMYMKSLSLKSSLAFILPRQKPQTRIGPHHEEIISVLVGSLLGDGYAERIQSGGVRFRFRQQAKHKEYIFWLHEFLSTRGYCNKDLPVLYEQTYGDKVHQAYRFGTFGFSSFIWLYNLFYTNSKVKVVPKNIADLLTPLALAIWICDDGTWKPGVRIATNCFTKEEVELLSLALQTKFNLKSSLHKNKHGKYFIQISPDSLKLLICIVTPYIFPPYLKSISRNNSYLSLNNRNRVGKNFLRKVGGVSRYHTLSLSPVQINPWSITGFADAESCFKIVVFKCKTVKSGWSVRCEFTIELHKKDLGLLRQIQTFFNGKGRIVNNKNRDSFIYIISKPTDLNNLIVPHFNKYPLLTQKWADFELFKMAVEYIINKDHLTLEGLQKILGWKASLNLGLPISLKESFPEVITVPRPIVPVIEIKNLNPYWLAVLLQGMVVFQ